MGKGERQIALIYNNDICSNPGTYHPHRPYHNLYSGCEMEGHRYTLAHPTKVEIPSAGWNHQQTCKTFGACYYHTSAECKPAFLPPCGKLMITPHLPQNWPYHTHMPTVRSSHGPAYIRVLHMSG